MLGFEGNRPLAVQVIRALDDETVREVGIPSLILMENAGAGAARVAMVEVADLGNDGVWVLCGPGNNGGDGLVVARHLASRGVPVVTQLLAHRTRYAGARDLARNLQWLEASGVEVRDVAPSPESALGDLGIRRPLVVDAMLGTGATGGPREPIRTWIEALAAWGLPILALDLPSGLNADTGEVSDLAVRAAVTATFVAPKPGFFCGEGPDRVGRIEIVHLPIPRARLDAAFRRQAANSS
ncbi:MAG: NAD(P)H-hydrate epimerase [Planctomycetes bacterium]|nr:NAD(P)H-hydrate epimerase [Planctomycetota bacterium]